MYHLKHKHLFLWINCYGGFNWVNFSEAAQRFTLDEADRIIKESEIELDKVIII